jgi:hypothetical protein
MADDITVKANPAFRKISARRGEAEARISFVELTARPEYYTPPLDTACASGQF